MVLITRFGNKGNNESIRTTKKDYDENESKAETGSTGDLKRTKNDINHEVLS